MAVFAEISNGREPSLPGREARFSGPGPVSGWSSLEHLICFINSWSKRWLCVERLGVIGYYHWTLQSSINRILTTADYPMRNNRKWKFLPDTRWTLLIVQWTADARGLCVFGEDPNKWNLRLCESRLSHKKQVELFFSLSMMVLPIFYLKLQFF